MWNLLGTSCLEFGYEQSCQDGPGTEPETGSAETVVPRTETGTAGTFLNPFSGTETGTVTTPFSRKVLKIQRAPFLQRNRPNWKPEPPEPFHTSKPWSSFPCSFRKGKSPKSKDVLFLPNPYNPWEKGENALNSKEFLEKEKRQGNPNRQGKRIWEP